MRLPKIFIISTFTLLVQPLFAQKTMCNKSTLTQTDKNALSQFWISLKSAINLKDKTKLATMIEFPFICDYCIVDKTKRLNENNLRVTNELFYKGQYKIFFDLKLKETINKTKDLYVFYL